MCSTITSTGQYPARGRAAGRLHQPVQFVWLLNEHVSCLLWSLNSPSAIQKSRQRRQVIRESLCFASSAPSGGPEAPKPKQELDHFSFFFPCQTRFRPALCPTCRSTLSANCLMTGGGCARSGRCARNSWRPRSRLNAPVVGSRCRHSKWNLEVFFSSSFFFFFVLVQIFFVFCCCSCFLFLVSFLCVQ